VPILDYISLVVNSWIEKERKKKKTDTKDMLYYSLLLFVLPYTYMCYNKHVEINIEHIRALADDVIDDRERIAEVKKAILLTVSEQLNDLSEQSLMKEGRIEFSIELGYI